MKMRKLSASELVKACLNAAMYSNTMLNETLHRFMNFDEWIFEAKNHLFLPLVAPLRARKEGFFRPKRHRPKFMEPVQSLVNDSLSAVKRIRVSFDNKFLIKGTEKEVENIITSDYDIHIFKGSDRFMVELKYKK